MYLFSQNIYTPNGFQEGYLKIEEGKILGILDEVMPTENIVDYGEHVIIPGFIDIHLHGWATGSFCFEGDQQSLKKMSKGLVKEGVTSYLATSDVAAIHEIKSQLAEGKKFIDKWNAEQGAEVLGFHLEGPFISKEYKGMLKEEYCKDPSIDLLDEFIEIAGDNYIKLMTLAPELPGAKELIKHANSKDIQISVGHSAAEFEDIKALKDYGLGGFTHTFSGMRGFHHRRLGVAGAAMYFDDMYAEFAKQTGQTVKPEAFELMYKIKGKEKIILSTDCVGLARVKEPFYHYIRKCKFIPDGDNIKLVYDDNKEEILSKDDYEKVKDLELSYIKSVRNVVKNVNATISDIIKMACENPAKYIGVDDKKGSIEIGKDADLLVIDEDWNIIDTFVRGVLQET
ncbi:N-acetylglucosamine-6-phosphate deacetylase [Clostridiaceae bacterium M8S5]|nr:N-acetylglucosamine-6-phosphate deacetylase [Clostridiaceae bacterium M8S5]